jgi:uncharacterized protein YpuA (DUF1002 family)
MILENFGIRVDLSFDMGVEAENYEEAVQVVKNIFEEQHSITLKDEEIDNNKVQDLIDELKYHLMYLIQPKEIKEIIFNIIEKLEGEVK